MWSNCLCFLFYYIYVFGWTLCDKKRYSIHCISKNNTHLDWLVAFGHLNNPTPHYNNPFDESHPDSNESISLDDITSVCFVKDQPVPAIYLFILSVTKYFIKKIWDTKVHPHHFEIFRSYTKFKSLEGEETWRCNSKKPSNFFN